MQREQTHASVGGYYLLDAAAVRETSGLIVPRMIITPTSVAITTCLRSLLPGWVPTDRLQEWPFAVIFGITETLFATQYTTRAAAAVDRADLFVGGYSHEYPPTYFMG